MATNELQHSTQSLLELYNAAPTNYGHVPQSVLTNATSGRILSQVTLTSQSHYDASSIMSTSTVDASAPVIDGQKAPSRPHLRRAWRVLFFSLLQLIFAAFFVGRNIRAFSNCVRYRVEGAGRHHHRSPQLIRNDVRKLSKIPAHLGAILNLQGDHIEDGGVDGLLNDCGELTAWSISAGVKELTIYERTGVLRRLPRQDVVRAIQNKLESYFGADGVPQFAVRSSEEPEIKSGFAINLLSERDGRATLVELTRTFANLASENKLNPSDVTVELVDEQLTSLVGHEPDLILMFTPQLDLQGFPPWHVRVSELYYLEDNDRMNYLVFKRAFQKFAEVKINLGR